MSQILFVNIDPDDVALCAASAASFATVLFYRQHGHLPQHQAISSTVITTLNNPNSIDPAPFAPDPDDYQDDELPW